MNVLRVWSTGIFTGLIHTIIAQTYTNCDPTNVICPPNLGLDLSHYYLDFTEVTSLPLDWIVPSWCNVTFNTNGRQNGAELEFLQRYDSPQLYSDFYFLFGRAEFVVQAANGPGIISDMMLLSDDLDELDWEFRGTLDWEVQTGWFGKGVTGLYNHSLTPNVSKPMTQFHTYAYDWTPDRVNWEADGVVVRTLQASDCMGTANQYPQTPMKLMVGLWDAGDPDHYDPWSAGMTPIPPPAGGYSFYVKSVEVWNNYPATCYNWTDHSGDWESIQAINDKSLCGASSASSSAVTSTTGALSSSLTFLTVDASSSTSSTSIPISSAMSSSASSANQYPLQSRSAIPSSNTQLSSMVASISTSTANSLPSSPASFSTTLGSSLSSTVSSTPSTPTSSFFTGTTRPISTTGHSIIPSSPFTSSSLSGSTVSSSTSIKSVTISSSIASSSSTVHTFAKSSSISNSITSLILSSRSSARNIVTGGGNTSIARSASTGDSVTIRSLASSALSKSTQNLGRSSSSLTSGKIKSPNNTIPVTVVSSSQLNTSKATAGPVKYSLLRISTSKFSHNSPANSPSPHTSSDESILDHLTQVLESVDDMILKGVSRSAGLTSRPSDSTLQSISAHNLDSVKSTISSSLADVASSTRSSITIFGSMNNYPHMTMSPMCLTTASSVRSTVIPSSLRVISNGTRQNAVAGESTGIDALKASPTHFGSVSSGIASIHNTFETSVTAHSGDSSGPFDTSQSEIKKSTNTTGQNPSPEGATRGPNNPSNIASDSGTVAQRLPASSNGSVSSTAVGKECEPIETQLYSRVWQG